MKQGKCKWYIRCFERIVNVNIIWLSLTLDSLLEIGSISLKGEVVSNSPKFLHWLERIT